MSDLKARLGRSAGAAFVALGLDPGLGRVTGSDRPDLAAIDQLLRNHEVNAAYLLLDMSAIPERSPR